MRRWCAAAACLVSGAGAVWGQGEGWDLYDGSQNDVRVPGLFPGPVLVNDWITPTSGDFADGSRWSLGISPQLGSVAMLARIRAVGGNYTITVNQPQFFWARVWGLLVDAPGATVSLNSYSIEAIDTLEVRRGTLRIPTNDLPAGSLAVRRLHVAGLLELDRPTLISYQSVEQAPEEIVITGEVRVNAPPSEFHPYASLHVGGSFGNDGRLVLGGPGEGFWSNLEVRGTFINRGELVALGGEGARPVRIHAGFENSGDFIIGADTTVARYSTIQQGPIFRNFGTIRVLPGGRLRVGPDRVFEQYDGALIIEPGGEFTVEDRGIEILGGRVEGEIRLLNSHLVTRNAEGGVFRLVGTCSVDGDLGPGQIVALGETTTAGGATATWSGGECRGAIEFAGQPGTSLVVSAPLINFGELRVRRGTLDARITSSGRLLLGPSSAVGRIGTPQVYDGPIEVEANAGGRLAGSTITIRGPLHLRASNSGGHQLQIFGDAALEGGTLHVEPAADFAPTWGRIYHMLYAFEWQGDFANIVGPALPDPNWRWEMERYAQHYRGRIAHIADVNRDLGIDFADINAVVAAWGSAAGGAADVDGDGIVGFGDLAIVVAHFGQYAD